MDLEKEKVRDLINQLVSVLDQYDINVGASAMIALLVESAIRSNISKEAWFEELCLFWSFYDKEINFKPNL